MCAGAPARVPLFCDPSGYATSQSVGLRQPAPERVEEPSARRRLAPDRTQSYPEVTGKNTLATFPTRDPNSKKM